MNIRSAGIRCNKLNGTLPNSGQSMWGTMNGPDG